MSNDRATSWRGRLVPGWVIRRLDRAYLRAEATAETRDLLRDPDFAESLRQMRDGVTAPATTAGEELAELIHDHWCDTSDPGRPCPRWASGSAHRDYYYARAGNIMAALEPAIGASNVAVAVAVILDEMS